MQNTSISRIYRLKRIPNRRATKSFVRVGGICYLCFETNNNRIAEEYDYQPSSQPSKTLTHLQMKKLSGLFLRLENTH